MFLYGLIRGVKLGLLSEKKTRPVIEKAYHGLCSQAIDKDGNIEGVCMGSGCGRDWQSYNRLKTVRNDDHATGIVLAAFSEYLGYSSLARICRQVPCLHGKLPM